MQYQDEIEKIKFYKARIIESFTRNNRYPSNVEIQKRLDSINMSLALLESSYIEQGSSFDCNAMNEQILFLYNDLSILYKLAYLNSVTRYIELKNYIDLYLNSLEIRSQDYINRAELMYNATTLGKVAFYSSNFELSQDNGYIEIDLGTFTSKANAKLYCLISGDGFSDDDVIFVFNDYNCSPYPVNKDIYIVSGESDTSVYNYSISDNDTITNDFIINAEGLTPDGNKIYEILGDEDKLSIVSSSEHIDFNKSYKFDEQQTIRFYLYDATYCNFTFTATPLYKNFSGTDIVISDKVHEIVLQCLVGTYFNIETNGTIYASYNTGYCSDNQLYCSDIFAGNDFFILETTNKDVEISCKVIIKNHNINDIDIKYIAIKEKS